MFLQQNRCFWTAVDDNTVLYCRPIPTVRSTLTSHRHCSQNVGYNRTICESPHGLLYLSIPRHHLHAFTHSDRTISPVYIHRSAIFLSGERKTLESSVGGLTGTKCMIKSDLKLVICALMGLEFCGSGFPSYTRTAFTYMEMRMELRVYFRNCGCRSVHYLRPVSQSRRPRGQ